MQVLDRATLLAKSERVIRLEGQSTEAGHDVEIRVRRVGPYEDQSLLPVRPPKPAGEADDPKETPEQRASRAVARELAWLESLPPAERVSRRSELLEAMYEIVARASIEPRLSREDVKRLGDDAVLLFAELAAFSGFGVKPAAQGNGHEAATEPTANAG